MQDLQGLTILNFENKANIVLGKAEVDKDGLGNYVELEEITEFNIQSNITNIFQNTCALTFNLALTNTRDKYSLYNKGASYYDYIKEGRKIRLYIGINLQQTIEGEEFITNINGSEYDDCIFTSNYYGEKTYEYVWNKVTGEDIYDLNRIGIGQNWNAAFGTTNIMRGYLYFDTSGIPENAIITKAVIKLYNYNLINDNNIDFDLVIQNGQPDYPHEPVEYDDYDRSKYSGDGGSFNIFDWVTDAYNELELNTDGKGWINKGGMTKFCIRSSEEIAGVVVSDSNEHLVYFCSQEHATEGKRPVLYLEYKMPNEISVDDYQWSWIYGIIDKPTMTYDENSEMCFISGRDYIAFLSETYLKKLWWGKNKKYDIVADQDKYSMPSDCTGTYRVFLDKTGTRTAFKEITLNSEYTYDWQTNELVFLIPSVPTEAAAGCLWVYYHTAINVATLVADLLTEAGIMSAAERYLWLANTNLCTPTAKTVQRAWFYSGTNYITAINMLTEVATIYRFYINGEGNPCFKRIPLLSTTIKRIDDAEYLIKSTEERLDELYNHFILIGEYRVMKKMNLSVIAYTALYDLATTSGELRGAILDNGGFTLTSRGFKWQTGVEAEQDWHEHTSAIGYYTHTITGLTPDTEYKFCAYGTNAGGDKKQSPWVYFRTLPE